MGSIGKWSYPRIKALAAYGASRSLPRVPVKVPRLNRRRPFALSRGNASYASKETLPARSGNGEVGCKCVIPDLAGPDVPIL